MDIDAYVAWARGMGPVPATPDATADHLASLALGLVADAGEIADLIKKRLRDGTLDRDHLAHELGDVLYYWARLCAVTGIPPAELLERSRRSIEARHAKRAAS
ncbi:MAG TPA: nucleoside triphosphate pyrophosphohydrolase family protein [Vineibacter sp.]|nr:nucleoside triphosphate pyrophosphohydrolase family protein [Vineibacter sp.]